MARKTKTQQIQELEERVARLQDELASLRKTHSGHEDVQRALRESEERFQALFENSRELLYIHDFEGNFLEANERALELLGYREEEIIRGNFADIMYREDLPRAMGGTLEVLKHKASRRPEEFRVRTRKEKVVWVEVSGVRLDVDGMPSAILGIGRDITDRKQSEQALRESEGRFRSMFNNAAEIICVYDSHGRLLDANERAVSTLGYSSTELLERSLQDIVVEDDVPIALENLRLIMEKGSLTETSEYRIQARDGRIIWVEVTGVRLSWQEGTPVILGTARDITSVKTES